MTYYSIGYNWIDSCRDRVLQYIICNRPYKIKKNYYNIVNYIKRKKKICTHITAKFANYRRNHTTNSLQYRSKYKNLKARKYKKEWVKKEKKKFWLKIQTE